MALVASVVERKKAESNENTFAVRPSIRQRWVSLHCGNLRMLYTEVIFFTDSLSRL